MGFALFPADYVEYLNEACEEIERNKDYITALDAKTGDGDHWVNMNMGFQKLKSLSEELSALPLPDMLKKVGMTMMSAVGGSSGVLYGGAYIAAGKALQGKESIDAPLLLVLLDAMLQSIMERGKARPGFKTMIDSLYQAAEACRRALDEGQDTAGIVRALQQGAREGMEATRGMEAVKGRASYQTSKGIGELDPGAVTMCMQLECLGETILRKGAV